MSFGNVELNWLKLFQAFSVKFTVIIFHECVHSIIPHKHMYVKNNMAAHDMENDRL